LSRDSAPEKRRLLLFFVFFSLMGDGSEPII
jgi:hypothetical protein